jgi:GNAT superfamily N-acetyltransferase
MSQINVYPIAIHDSKAVDKFIKFAWEIYKGNPYWVPPLLMDIKKTLNPNNPFYEVAQIQLFLAERNGKIVGRIAAVKNDLHNQIHHEQSGHFGFFECVNDQSVANILFDTASAWCKERGLDYIIGPASPSINHEYGLLVNAFDDSPRLMMSYNPPYYQNLIESYDFKCIKGLNAYKIDQNTVLSNPKFERIARIAQERSQVTLRPINLRRMKEEVEIVKNIFNAAWEKNWGAIPILDKEIDAMAADLKQLVDESLVIFMEKDNEPIGFTLVLRDYNYIFKQMNGRLFPFNFLKLFTQKKKIEWARIILLGVLPAYRGKGLDAVLYYEVVKNSRKLGIKYGEASWILEDNLPMTRAAEEVMSGVLYKKYNVYGKAIG